MNVSAPRPEQQATQSRHPWRATLRSTLAALLAVLPALPEISRAAGVETVPTVMSVLAINAAVTRVLAIPQVEQLLRQLLPSLAADPEPSPEQTGRHRRNDP